MKELDKINKKNSIVRLSEEEQKTPQAVIVEFFLNYHLRDFKSDMWDLLTAGLSAERGKYETGEERANLLFLIENVEKLAEASYLLLRKNEKSKKDKS